MLNIGSLHLPPTKVAGVIAGAVGLAAGGVLAASITRSCYRQDAFSDSYQVLDESDGYVLKRPRPKIGPVALGGGLFLGAAIAGASSLVSKQSVASSVVRQGLREGGMGLVLGAVGAAFLYQGVQVERA